MCDLCAVKLHLLIDETFAVPDEDFKRNFGDKKIVLIIPESCALLGPSEIIDSLLTDAISNNPQANTKH